MAQFRKKGEKKVLKRNIPRFVSNPISSPKENITQMAKESFLVKNQLSITTKKKSLMRMG